MNLYQTLRQIRHKLTTIDWPGTSNGVFASESIIVSVGPEKNAMWQRRFPVVLIRPGSSIADSHADEDPRFMTQNISLRLVQAVPGDDVGEMTLLGAHHPEIQPSGYSAAKTTSSGKGLLQIEEQLLGGVQTLGPDDGIFMLCRSKGSVDAVVDETMGYVCWRDYQFEAQITTEATFAKPRDLKLATTTLTWKNPARYDFYKVILRYNSSSTPPTSITGGTGITLGAADSETATGATGKAYALFATYDDYHDTPAQNKDVSPAEILIT
jgi:hypothetical protein